MKTPSLRRSAKVVAIVSMLRRPPATCDFGKSLLSDQRMNGPIGIMRLRAVIGSLAATVAAILLYGSNHADAQAPQGIGIMYLTPSDQAGQPFHDLTGAPEWTNSAVQGVTLRTQWARVEPHENDFYWGYLDQGMALGAAHNKKIAILITAGVSCPQWLFDAGAPAFNVTTQSGYSAITDGETTAGSTTVTSAGDTAGWNSVSVGLQIFGGSIPAGATIVGVNASYSVTISDAATETATGVAITTAQILPMPLPWDPIFQQKWGAFVQAFAARYGNDPNLAYVVMGGPGRNEEAYFCFTPYDIDYFINTLGGLPSWELGVKWIIDQYATYFPNTPFMLAMADPIPTTDGDNSLKTVVNYGVAQHPGNHFGVISCGLQYPNGPTNGSMGATEIPLLCPTSTVGYQFLQTQHEDIDPVTGRFMLDLGLERGFNFGAHFIEVYNGDCDDPVLAPVLTAWGALLTTTPPIPAAPSRLTATATSSSTIALSWRDNANNEIGTRMERSVGSNHNYAFLTNVGANITAFTDTGLVDGTKYSYRVRAFNTGGSSTYSNQRFATTPLASPTSLTLTVVSSSQVNLNWTDNSMSETAYLIERKETSSGNYSQIGSVGMNVQSYTDTYNFAPGKAYYYRVRAAKGTIYSGYSNQPHVKPNP